MNYCKACMDKIDEYSDLCPVCRNKPKREVPSHHLKPYTVLKERYKVGYALGQGGFGITYIGRDFLFGNKVAVKEYYPSGFVNRNHTVSQELIAVSGKTKEEFYEKGKKRFWDEAIVLAKQKNKPGIVEVIDIFEENNTIYIVMEYLDGQDLKGYLKEKGTLNEKEVLEIMKPLMEVLEQVHQDGLIHRDISPDNIRITSSGKIKLMDFGAAKDYTEKNSLSIMLKHGYAPEEQYRSKGKQGPWTDVYALCATIYKCITGIKPLQATDRLVEDELKKPSELGVNVSESFEKALLRGLAVSKDQRIQSMKELLEAFDYDDDPITSVDKSFHLVDDDTETEPTDESVEEHVDNNIDKQVEKTSEEKKSKLLPMVIGLTVVATLIIGVVTMLPKEQQSLSNDSHLSSDIVNNQESNNEQTNNNENLSIIDWISDTEASISKKELHIENIKEIAECDQLKKLTLDRVSVKSDLLVELSELWKLKNLEELNVTYCKSLDFSFVSNLKKLKKLILNDCELTNDKLSKISFLNMSNLKEIVLKNNPELDNVDGLLNLPTKLHKIDISKTNIDLNSCRLFSSDVVSDLKILYAASMQSFLGNVDFLVHLPKLANINFAYNNLGDTKGLLNCTNLKKLNLSNSSVTSLENLINCKYLEILHADNNPILSGKLNGIEDCSNLKELHMNECGISDIQLLENFTQLIDVDLSNNKIEDIIALNSSSQTLKYLSIMNNPIEDIDFIRNMTSLELLRIDGTKSSSFMYPQSQLIELTMNGMNNLVTDADLLRSGIPSLKQYYVNNNFYTLTESGWTVIEDVTNEEVESRLEGTKNAYWR